MTPSNSHTARVTLAGDAPADSLLVLSDAAKVMPTVGAVIGLLFPPSTIASAAVGAAVGGIGGHLWRGMSRADVKEFGEVIDSGSAALVVVGESTIEQAVDKAALKAEKRIAKELNVKPSDIDAAIQQAPGKRADPPSLTATASWRTPGRCAGTESASADTSPARAPSEVAVPRLRRSRRCGI